jgi:acetyltransferase-like isoleucine patch superfamily enzyme
MKQFLRNLRRHPWATLWMQFAGPTRLGRAATWLAALGAPPYKARAYLAELSPRGYVAPSASIHHSHLSLGNNTFVGDRVTIYEAAGGGRISIGDRARIHQDAIIDTGRGGSITIGANTDIQPRCQISAYLGSVEIGCGVQIAPNCAFYPYDHGIAPGRSIRSQPLTTKGGITVGDDAWLGFGVIVLDGVRIGHGAVIGAGSVVTESVPDGAIAAGVPARVIGSRAAQSLAVGS